MKKIFLSFTLLLALFLNKNIFASELNLYSQDGFDISTDSFIQNETKTISLVKNSNLNIIFTNDKDFSKEEIEPKIDLNVYKKDSKDIVFSIKTPSKKMSGDEGKAFDNYLQENKLYFDTITLAQNKVIIKLPLNFVGGKYDIDLKIDTGVKKSNLDYSFLLSDSYYNFTISDILVEDSSILANIGYKSLLETNEINKVIVTLTQTGSEIFRKEIDKKFYSEGSIIVNEEIPALKNLKGNLDLKIEIKDKDNKIILSQSKVIDLYKKGNMKIYYIMLGILFFLLIVLFIIFKIKKVRTFIAIFTLILLGSFSFLTSNINAASKCGTKPADKCVENQLISHVCQSSEASCSINDIRVKKFFSPGNILNIPSESKSSGPASVTVNICKDIAETLSEGNKFYVISDTNMSSWQRQRYHVFSFIKGVGKNITFDDTPRPNKRTISYAQYNGICDVTVYAEYRGDNTDFPGHKTTVVEVGKISSDMCKSRVVNEDVFETNGGLFDKPDCNNKDNGGLRNTYIAGSVYMEAVETTGDSSWQDKTVNVCDKLGVNVNTAGNRGFYVLMEQNSSWTMIRFPIYQFKFGVVSQSVSDLEKKGNEKNGHNIKEMYRYTAYKENVPSVSYNGACNVTFRLYKHGADTDSWSSGYNMMELGWVNKATCRDVILTDSSTYKIEGRGISSGQIEKETKFHISNVPKTYGGWGGRYANIAKFFYGDNGTGSVSSGALPVCRAATQCTLDYDWMEYLTDKTCGAVINGSCGKTNNICITGTLNDTADVGTDYKWSCNGTNGGTNSSCSVSSLPDTALINGSCGTTNNTCLLGTLSDSDDTADYYKWSCNGKNSGTNIATNSSCSLDKKTALINGSCGATNNTCISGVSINTTDTTTDYKWSCNGTNGGTNSSCSTSNTYTTLVNGQCSPTDKNVCISGTQAVVTNKDDNTEKTYSCNGKNGGTNAVCSTDKNTTSIIDLTKDPKIVLNKGGKCTISWNIQNISEPGAKCILTGLGIDNKDVTNTTSSTTISNLLTNQKYTLTCTGLISPSTIIKSVICRVNPDVKEN